MAILGKSGQRKKIFLFLGASLVISGKRGTIKYPLPVRASHMDNMESMLFFKQDFKCTFTKNRSDNFDKSSEKEGIIDVKIRAFQIHNS